MSRTKGVFPQTSAARSGDAFVPDKHIPGLPLLVSLLFLSGPAGAVNVTQWGVFEKTLTSPNTYTSAQKYSGVTLNATFTGPGEIKYTVPGFWDDDHIWRIRFSPARTGNWTYIINSSDNRLADPANNGSFTCVAPGPPALDANPNLRGFLRISPDRRRFVYADGTPFFWMGEDGWKGNSGQCRYDTDPGDQADHRVPEFRTWIDNRNAKKFNVAMYIANMGNEGGDIYRVKPTVINPDSSGN